MRALQVAGLLSAGLVAVSCGASAPDGPDGATPTPRPAGVAVATATAAPSATPTSAPAATEAPSDALQAGPVKYLRAGILWAGAGGVLRDPPFDDGQGHQVVILGETVVFDLTPRNVANNPCVTVGNPSWTIRDNADAANHEYLTVLNSDNPFVLRVRANARTNKALVHLWAEVDGVASNHLFVTVR